MIDERIIEQLLDRADPVDVIGRYVELRKKGSVYWACCPLHQEKTPSFCVNPARGTWHCFGCGRGGNVIGFLMEHEAMNFPEAVRTLARQYGIEVEEQKLTPEQEQQRMKRESMFIINERCAEHFRQNLLKPEHKAARDYIEGRWGREYAEETGIGYAPDTWDDLLHFAQAAGLSPELMTEMGLLKRNERGRYYDGYRGRAVIPIRNRTRQIIGFTARDMTGAKDTAKYINPPENDIYHKRSSIFGIDLAARQAAKEGKFYLVEGAPDAMQLQRIRINNAVAPLGGAWMREQLEQLKKYAKRVCILPDADPPNPERGEKLGAGTRNALKNGELAMQCGLAVSIKEIPLGEGGAKQDPDSFCTNRPKFDGLEEEDFIAWFARYVFQEVRTTEERGEAVNRVCALLALVQDDMKEGMYIKELSAKGYADKAAWASALRRAKKLGEADRAKKARRSLDVDMLGTYGFMEMNGGYYAQGEKSWMQWSNFTMTPMFHIKDSLLPKRLYRIVNEKKKEEIIEMKQEDLVSLQKFKIKIEGLGNYIWYATEKELTRLKSYLYEQTETALEITQLGWQRQGFFAYGNGCYDGEWHEADQYGIVRLKGGNYYLPGCSVIYRDDAKLFQFERRFVYTHYNNISLRDFADKLITVFGDNAKVGLCFLLAALFRDVIAGQTKSFPILNLFGPKGSGKSELGHSLMSFFIIKNTPPNIQNATIAALGDAVAQCANALVHIDEYKNSIDLDKREFLKGLWDGTGRSRMNMDRDKKREITAVDCGVILSGQEMPTIDIALFSRLIYLTFTKTEFTTDEKRAFDDLKAVRDLGLSHLTLQLLQHRAKVEAGFSDNYRQCMDDLNNRLRGETVEDRIQRNWVIPLAVFRTLEAVIGLPFSYPELLQVCVDGILRQNRETKSNNELANFWNVVSYLQQDGEIFLESDFRIDYLDTLKTNKTAVPLRFKTPRPILRLRTDRIFPLYKKYSKQVGDAALPTESLNFYLENSHEYLGVQNSVRFKVIQKGVEVTKEIDLGGTKRYYKQSITKQALCFDYAALMEAYNINLNVETRADDTPGEGETKPNDTGYQF